MDKGLEHFVAVAEAGSFMAAAEILHISQPALSYNIKRLEQSLGVDLFIRSVRGVELTPYGETLYNSAIFMSRLHTNALAAIARQKAELEEGISIGTGYSTWILLLKDYVIAHFNAHPAAPINVSIGNMMRCMDQLIAGDIALFMGHRIDHLKPGLAVDFIPLGHATDGYYVRNGHPLLGRTRSIDEIRSYPTTMANPTDARQKRLTLGSGAQDLDVSGHAFACNSMSACIEFALNTDAVLIHSDVLRGYFSKKGLQEVKIDRPSPRRQAVMGFYVLSEMRAKPKIQEIIESISTRAEVAGLFPSAT
ncbi:LysR family transcriptional regulator [Rhizobiales bacterium RZME27]|jgi:LysR family transcriptional regulator of abg operon|uniref:LysR family transcriptional regulator n=1 Tax=Endobacterium cereale TaxID=2663029 RepID=A0A6A8A7D1_9HYPH|nr:LysR family transcriptional regulator [Endobacterium cereale]MEB2847988.1 LysR family transcriptional regulator [Endobacterium cereale]MQY46679.1 LysR family transcriptional regulator [Endobacterium cereale]